VYLPVTLGRLSPAPIGSHMARSSATPAPLLNPMSQSKRFSATIRPSPSLPLLPSSPAPTGRDTLGIVDFDNLQRPPCDNDFACTRRRGDEAGRVALGEGGGGEGGKGI